MSSTSYSILTLLHVLHIVSLVYRDAALLSSTQLYL